MRTKWKAFVLGFLMMSVVCLTAYAANLSTDAPAAGEQSEAARIAAHEQKVRQFLDEVKADMRERVPLDWNSFTEADYVDLLDCTKPGIEGWMAEQYMKTPRTPGSTLPVCLSGEHTLYVLYKDADGTVVQYTITPDDAAARAANGEKTYRVECARYAGDPLPALED